jgi:hypothetical protein
MDLTDRQMRALQMRRDGMKLREIAAALQITTSRARQLIERAKLIEDQASWAEGLPSRYVTVLLSRGFAGRAQLESAVADGSLSRMPGIGTKCYEVIVAWLGK